MEGLHWLRNLCHGLEGDSGDLIFTGGKRIRNLKSKAPPGSLPPMPSTDRLMKNAVEYAQATPEGAAYLNARTAASATKATPRPTLAEVQASVQRPRRVAAVQAVQRAARAHESSAQKKSREQREAAKIAADQAALDDAYDKAVDDAVAEEARLQALSLPMDVAAWRAIVDPPLLKAYSYFWAHTGPGGDRHDMVKLILAASIFDPAHARTLSRTAANDAIEDLRILDRLNDDAIMKDMKDGFPAAKYYAHRALCETTNVVQWWHDHRHVLPDDRRVPGTTCKFCGAAGACRCETAFESWWNTVQVLALVQPSSAGAERVFSRLKLFWDHLQTRTLTDCIAASLFLCTNKREL